MNSDNTYSIRGTERTIEQRLLLLVYGTGRTAEQRGLIRGILGWEDGLTAWTLGVALTEMAAHRRDFEEP